MSGSNLTKEQRREAAREKARLLQEQEKKRLKRNKIIAIVSSIVVLALVVFAVVKIVGGSKAVAESKNVQADYGILIDSTGAATTNVMDVPQVGIYEDTICIHCWELEAGAKEAIDAHMAAGDVQFTIYPVSIFPQQQSSWGAAAMFYIASEAPAQLHDYHSIVMGEQSGIFPRMQAGEELPIEEFVAAAQAAGVPQDVVDAMPDALESTEWKNYVNSATRAFTEKFKEQAGTPTVMLNGEKEDAWGNPQNFGAWLDQVVEDAS
ncbi:MAG: DsbA family protein [Actinomycetaceae bacterium]|nr:DsbA family protein [Arcanobacterium sp.]MDD7505506.1 DsbA family protein [Actinomycetaceae bacterium]MDY6143487.1 DsbA family protein [Arcanobacterium sp.]